jgi:O-methyltransferase involved in polyketide biosynthesis
MTAQIPGLPANRSRSVAHGRHSSAFDGVSVTMLWSLHNRASEARRPDGILDDPESIYIQSAIDYDFARHFGGPLGSLAGRAVEIDRALRSWLARHPDGIVVSPRGGTRNPESPR